MSGSDSPCLCRVLRSRASDFRQRRSAGLRVMEMPVRMRQTRMHSGPWESPPGIKCQTRSTSMMIDDFILARALHLLALVTGSVVWQWSPPLCCRAPARYQTCVLRLQPSERLSADLSPRCASRFCSLFCPASPQQCWQTEGLGRWYIRADRRREACCRCRSPLTIVL